MTTQARAYQPLTLAGLAVLLTGADEPSAGEAAFRRRGVYVAPQELEVA